jgi:hypothetical protein
MATVPIGDQLEMFDAHLQDNGLSLLQILDRLAQQGHGAPAFPNEVLDDPQGEAAQEMAARREARIGQAQEHDREMGRQRRRQAREEKAE